MDSPSPPRWSRPAEGRLVSGVAAAFAQRGRLSPRAWRAMLLLGAFAGAVVIVAFGIFDHSLFGGPGPLPVRVMAITVGLALLFAYPILALLLPDGRKQPGWDFGSAVGMVLLLVCMGQALGMLVEPWWGAASTAWRERGASGFFTWVGDYSTFPGFGVRDLVVAVFLPSAIAFAWANRTAVRRFFRSMHVGVTLVSLTTLAVAGGVLVPQIEGFEDPDARVDLVQEELKYQTFLEYGYEPQNRRSFRNNNYRDFRWAEGYFLWHLAHLYGIGMPESSVPPRAEEGLERYAVRYGEEEAANSRKLMLAANSGRAKSDEIYAFVGRNEHAFWRGFQAATLLDLNRAYKSNWFAWLLVLLGTAVAFNTVKNKPRQLFTVQKLGYFVVHCGILTLLVGGLVSNLFTERGLLELWLGRGPRDVYYRYYDPTKLSRMPFAVGLDHFARKDWKSLEVHFPDEGFTARPPRYTLWNGRTIDLDYVDDGEGGTRPRIRVIVERLHEKALAALPNVEEAQGAEREKTFAAAEVLVHDAHLFDPDHQHRGDDDHSRRVYLLPVLPQTSAYLDPGKRFRLAAAFGDNPESKFPARDGELGFLEVLVRTGDEPRATPFRVEAGRPLAVDEGWTITVVDATSDYDPARDDAQGSSHPLPLGRQPFGQAAVWLDLTPPDGGEVERRLVIEGIDAAQHGQQGEFEHDEVELRFVYDPWSAPGPPRYLLHWGEGAEPPRLLSERGPPLPVQLNQPLPIPDSDANPVVPLQVLERARFTTNVRFLPPEAGVAGWDADFYARTPRGAELTVVVDPGTADEVRHTVELASTEDYLANFWRSPPRAQPDGSTDSFVLFFAENSEMLPYEWRSVLSIYDTDEETGRIERIELGPERAREIRVNDYLYYGGYRFFQTNAKAEDPAYSGIGVVYDPGIPIVLFGMYVIIGGTVIAFLVRPIVLARRARSSA